MLTTIATFTEPWEAHLFAGRLRAEGLIPSIAFEQHVWTILSIESALLGVPVPPSETGYVIAKLASEAGICGCYAQIMIGSQTDCGNVNEPGSYF